MSTPRILITLILAAACAFGGQYDPGCASTDDIGKFWMDNTTTTTVPKLCVDVAGTMAWKTLTLAP